MAPAPTKDDLAAYFDRLAELLAKEDATDQERTSLLATRCSFDELAHRGLAVNGLSVSSISLGLGGKSLVSLTRSSAFHSDPKFTSHGFRNGDPAKIAPQTAVRKTTGKSKGADEEEREVEGVVYKVTDTSITLAVSEPKEGEDLDFPERCRLIKTANSGTFNRMEKAIERVRRILQVPTTSPPSIETVQSDVQKEVGAPTEVKAEQVPIPSATPTPAPSSPAYPTPTSEEPPSGDEGLPQPGPPTDTELNQASGSPLPSNHPSRQLLETLYGISPASFSTDFETVANIKWFDESLNASQKEAVRFALSMQEVGCIHGPPGTGKTHTLVEVIRQLVSTQDKRVLVCGASNLSVDNLLLRLSPLFPPTHITRIGHPARILPALLPTTLDYQTAHSSSGEVVKDVKSELEGHLITLANGRKEKGAVKGKKRGEVYGEVRELRKEFRKREGKVVRDVLSSTKIVLATCHTAGSRQIMKEDFDVVIIDEATQALEAVCLIPILKAKKLILAGDPCQLGPTILSAKPSSSTGKIDKKKGPKDKPAGKVASTEGESVVAPPTSNGAEESAETIPVNDTAPALAPDEQLFESAKGLDLAQSSSDDNFLPTRLSLRPPRSLEMTLFGRLEKLYGPAIKRILTVQYRMNTSIAAFPSKALYSSLLESAPTVADRTLTGLPLIDDSEEAVEFLEPTVVFIDTNGCEFYERTDEGGGGGEGSKRNENEAELVRSYVEKLISFGVQPADIAVLAAYQAQVAEITALLKSDHPDLLIGTVDSLQGQEREAVVLSLVRSNAQREVGFLSEERRLNVAMTRAKRQLCVIGDSGTVANGSPYLKSWMGWLEENAEVRFAMDE